LNPAGHQILSMVTVNRRVFYLTVDWAVWKWWEKHEIQFAKHAALLLWGSKRSNST
jgi:hypothetical protein